jgi:hypothetical protein
MINAQRDTLTPLTHLKKVFQRLILIINTTQGIFIVYFFVEIKESKTCELVWLQALGYLLTIQYKCLFKFCFMVFAGNPNRQRLPFPAKSPLLIYFLFNCFFLFFYY